ANGVLKNDTDADNDVLTAVLITAPFHGTVALSQDGSFQYTPDPGFEGEESFTYSANDGQMPSAAATVHILVGSNHYPVVFNHEYTVPFEGTIAVPATSGLLSTESDPNGDPLTVSLTSQPPHGTVALNADGSFTYTAGARFHGDDSLPYIVSD